MFNLIDRLMSPRIIFTVATSQYILQALVTSSQEIELSGKFQGSQ